MPRKPDPTFDPDFAGPAQWAAEYRAYGLQIIPCYSPGEVKPGTAWKRPALSEWVPLQEALVSDATFGRWYDPATGEHRNRRNMGLLTGRCSDNAYIIDLDIHKNAEAAGWWNKIMVVHNNGLELETPRQRTGGGGLQLLFRAPPGFIVPTNRTTAGVDIRGQGGFAVLPPSLHETGNFYEWVEGCSLRDLPILMSPDWLLEEIIRLVLAHGGTPGGGARAKSNGGASAGDLDAFGHVIDGRETYMRDMIWAALIGYRVDSPIPPGIKEFEATLADYHRNASARSPQPNEQNEAALEREGRGMTLFKAKWAYALGEWHNEIAEAAKQRPPQPEKASTPPPPQPDPAQPAAGIPLVSAFPIDGASIPVRNWVVVNVLLKQHLSMLIAPPGSGKSLFTLQFGIAIAAGTPWGGWAARRTEKVLILNTEDDKDELNRRMFAAAEEMKINQTALAGRVLMPEPDAVANMVVAQFDARTKSVIRTPLVAKLVETIKANGIGVVIVDPFAETFEVDENSNSQIKWAGSLWREIARVTGCALWLVHHTKKYANDMAGDPDAGRGGGSMTGIARVMSTLFGMTEDEALAMNIDPDNRHSFVRFDDAKMNYGLKGQVRWFEKRTVTLPNGTAVDPADTVGVLVPWVPPGALDGVSTHDIGLALDAIDRGTVDAAGGPTGQFFTASITTASRDRWAGNVLMRMLNCTEQAARNLIKDWLKKNVLETFDFVDPLQRKTRKGVRSISQNRPGRGGVF